MSSALRERLIYIPAKLFVAGDATATARNIAANETLFRLGIVSELTCGVIVLFLTFALYRLFEGVNRNWAVVLVVTGGILPAAIDFVIGATDAAALMLVRGANYLNVFEQPQREALALLFLRLHHHQVVAAEMLWGIWLFPLGMLAYRSRLVPKFIGVWLYVNGVAYIVTSFVVLLAPRYERAVSTYSFPALLGEIAIMLWLLIKGAQPEGLRTETPSTGAAR